MRHNCVLLLLLSVGCLPVLAQDRPFPYSSCEVGKATADLNINNVTARVYNTGWLFFNAYDTTRAGWNNSQYAIPKRDSLRSSWGASFWMGGYVENKLRHSRPHFGFNSISYWPGPLDDNGQPPADCAVYDAIFSLTRDDLEKASIDDFTENVLNWPVDLGAPVVDGDGVSGNYNLEGGDRPALLGDQMAWWIMNDLGNDRFRDPRNTAVGDPLEVEIRVSAYAYAGSGRSFIDNTTLYRYQISYHGDLPLEKAYFGFYAELIAGESGDDLAGTDSLLNLLYVYDDDNEDWYYASGVPAIGMTMIRGPLADLDRTDNNGDGVVDEPGERLNLSASIINNDVHENYGIAPTYSHLSGGCGGSSISGIWHAEDRDCHVTIQPGGGATSFWYTGDPLTGEGYLDLRPGYKPGMISVGPITMQPGDVQEFAYAIVWAQDETTMASVAKLRKQVASLQLAADVVLTPALERFERPRPPALFETRYSGFYPNPFTRTSTATYEVSVTAPVRVEVFDMLGRSRGLIVDAVQQPGRYTVEIRGDDYEPGVYLYRISVGHLTDTGMITRIR